MRIWRGMTVAALAAALAACQPGGGGGETETTTELERRQAAASPSPAGVDAGLARDYLGNAFVSAARVHTAVVNGEYRAARSSLNNVRRQMDLAERHATLEQQKVINRIESQVIDLQGELEGQSPGAMQQSNQLVRSFFDYYQQLATAGGGAGQVPPRQRELESDYPPPAQLEQDMPAGRQRVPAQPRDPVGAEEPTNKDLEQPFSP